MPAPGGGEKPETFTRGRLAALTLITVAVSAVLIGRWSADLFGPGTWGTGGNLIAWALCGGLSFAWLHLVLHERHVQALALAVTHHQAALAQAERHHAEKLAQAEKHHREALGLARTHHDSLSGRPAAGS